MGESVTQTHSYLSVLKLALCAKPTCLTLTRATTHHQRARLKSGLNTTIAFTHRISECI